MNTGVVNTLKIWDNLIFVGGSFSEAYNCDNSPLLVNNVAYFNITAWSWNSISTGLPNSIVFSIDISPPRIKGLLQNAKIMKR